MAAAQAVGALHPVKSSCLGRGLQVQFIQSWELLIIKVLRNCSQDVEASSQESHSLAWSLLALGSFSFHLKMPHTYMCFVHTSVYLQVYYAYLCAYGCTSVFICAVHVWLCVHVVRVPVSVCTHVLACNLCT